MALPTAGVSARIRASGPIGGQLVAAKRLAPSAAAGALAPLRELRRHRIVFTAPSELEEALASRTRRLEGSLRAETERLLARARAFVSRVQLVIEPPVARGTIDGAPASPTAEGGLSLTVGDHVIEVEADG